MPNQYTKLGRPSVADQTFTDIQQHMLDPVRFPLPEGMQDVFDRVVAAARLLDDYPEDRQCKKMLRAKFPNVTLAQLQKDVDLARELFKTQHKFDWDFWRQWRINDILKLLKRAKERDDLKMWNEAHKTLQQIIGDKPEAIDDPRRMERNLFFIQVNNGTGKPVYVPLDKIRSLKSEELGEFLTEVNDTIDDEQTDALFNS